MSEIMVFVGRRMLANCLDLEPGRAYKVSALDRKFGREGFWIEVTDDMETCRLPYKSADEFTQNWRPYEGR
ncbi:hypothetical protein [Slackia heliotrinireducens]|jgi:hypothetical protein|uniref:Uncharacterized protein n=1 Tax=Slackia heliotrinireducens (strain ATCC 29202 / DSM 20476 / NCTC 11029 / RHS 1) TaxID=471855 RepID=C7N5L6_SLAHD|nr:hypothetical protein [Slackia heliotrinireducens]ACV22201.1 hypothetical protein Shel_11680 [Slackia heliotrinireducens DSM 20476]VEH00306.1 Uncharacterised protein [Slackia heliotrinireducens]